MKKSPNLSVSRVRLQVRNLPKRDFYENELKALTIKLLAAFNEERKQKDHFNLDPAFKELRAKAVIK